jgi:peptide/nickel transport system ATP-binding protein
MVMAPHAALLQAKDLGVVYGTGQQAVPAVRNVSLELERGQVLGIVGESGSGKSTLAHALMGYRPAGASASGSVVFDGTSLLELPRRELRALWGRRMAMIHQNPLATLTPNMTVGRQISETMRQHLRVSAREARDRSIAVLEAVNIPDPQALVHRYPHQLSGGQRQRISIAIALGVEPELLILDEPTTNLDVTTEAVILDLLNEIQSRTGSAMIYISHNLGVIARIATRVSVMYAGELVETASAASLFARPSHPYTRALLACLPRRGLTKRESRLRSIGGSFPSLNRLNGGCIFSPRCPQATARCAVAPDWSAVAPDHAVRCWHTGDFQTETPVELTPATGLATGSRPVLTVSDLTKTFGQIGIGSSLRGGIQAVSEASLSVSEASVVGLVGESGSGKTTLLRCIAGLEAFEAGEVSFQDKILPASLRRRGQEVLRAMQMVFQDPDSTLNPALTVGENLTRHLVALRPENRADPVRIVATALERVRLDPSYGSRLPHALSGGERQRVAIARAFLSEPDVVLCDEPLSALDVSVQSAIVQLLLDLQKDRRASYLLVSHDLSIVRYVADHIVVMYLGEVLESGPSDSFDRLPLHPYTEALFSAIPTIDGAEQPRIIRLTGQIRESDKLEPGCIFASRCPRSLGTVCREQPPAWQEVGGRRYRCHISPADLLLLQSDRQTADEPT